MGFLGSLLRQGTEFGLGAIQGQRQREAQAAEQAKADERDALEMAMMQFNFDNAQRQATAQARAASDAVTRRNRTHSLRRDLLGEVEGLSDPTRSLLMEDDEAFGKFFQSQIKPPEIKVDQAYEARRLDLINRGASPSEAAAIATSPTLYGDYIERSTGGGGGDPTGQRHRVLNAASDLNDIEQAVAENKSDIMATKFTDEEIQAMIGNVLRRYSFASVDELAAAMKAFGGEQPAAAPAPVDNDPLGIRN